jgi:DNA-binding beta-propeller fold protein YncE
LYSPDFESGDAYGRDCKLLLKSCVVATTQLIDVVRLDVDDRRVVGLTSVDSHRLFVLRAPSEQQIEVYETTSFKLQQTLNVAGLSDHEFGSNGLISCVTNNCLYVSDYRNATVYKIELTGDNQISEWQLNSRWPIGLSLNTECNVLISCFGDNRLLEYTSSGSLVREIKLQVMVPSHAIQVASDQFVVCTSWSYDVAEVNSRGQIVVSYGSRLQSTTRHQFNSPHQIAVDKNNEYIFVADKNNDRIVMLSRSLKCAREFNALIDGSRLRPRCLYLNESNGRLYVGGGIYGSSIFVFDIRRR